MLALLVMAPIYLAVVLLMVASFPIWGPIAGAQHALSWADSVLSEWRSDRRAAPASERKEEGKT
jgi:hypothetical protein